MVLSRQVYISDGTTKQYPIAFADGYLSRDEVNVYEEYDDGTPDKDIPFTFINDNLIQLTTVPKSGTRIVIERDVEATARKVVFIPQYIKSSDLNTMYQHLLYLIQALMDGRLESTIKSDLDMGYNNIINLGAPTNDNDAVRLVDIKTYTDLAKSLNQQNAAYAAAAKVSETNAKASENAAKASQTAAAASAKSAANTVNGFDAHAAKKQQDFDANAANKQAQVDASAEEARKWAVGTISEQPNGSAKYWAEQAKTVTDGTLNESILTNCLTEIPQDIKVELSNGTLTLKAGSKVYVPNGVGKFDVVTIQKDVGGTRRSRGQEFLLSDENAAAAFWGKLYSGDSKPVASGSYVWYDTANNVIKATLDGGASWLSAKFSLPLCIYTADGTRITSIDQVFNGFGYIGNTIFALPGIKGRVPNGFSTDGKPYSIELTTTKVSTRGAGANNNAYGAISTGSSIGLVPLAAYKYDYITNTQSSAGTVFTNGLCAFIYTSDSTGRITSLTPNTAFHAVDYSEYARELDNKVSKTGNETIAGIKTFSQGDIRGKTSTDSHYGVARYATFDKDGVQYSDLWITRSEQGNSNGISYAGLRVSNSSGSVSNRALAIYKKENSDDIVTVAPTPPISDNGGQIATTAWVNNKFQKVSTLPAQPDPNVTYLIPEE